MRGWPRRTANLIVLLGVVAAKPALADDVEMCVDAATRGQEDRDRGDLSSAHDAFIACAQPECPEAVATSCAEWLADVKRRIPSVVFRARDSQGADLRHLAVRIDATVVLEELTGRSVTVNPGHHRVRFERSDGTFVERELLFAEGEKDRLVVVDWPPASEPSSPAPGRNALPKGFWVLGGVGVAALGTAGVLGLTAIDDASSLRGSCGPRCPQSELDQLKQTLLFADLAAVVGVVSLGLAAYFALTSSPRAQSSSTVMSSRTMLIP